MCFAISNLCVLNVLESVNGFIKCQMRSAVLGLATLTAEKNLAS